MKFWIKRTKNCKIAGFILGCIYSFALVFGRELYQSNTLYRLFSSLPSFLLSIGLTLLFTLITGLIFSILFNYISDIKSNNNQTNHIKKHPFIFFVAVWLIMLIGWIPAFIAYFPGIAKVYDFSNQAAQAYAGVSNFSKHHPPLHTFLILLTIKLGEKTGLYAVTIYGAVQLIFLSFILAFQMFILLKNDSSVRFLIISLVYFALNPTFAIFSIIPVKDAVFGGFFVLFTIFLYLLFKDTQSFFNTPTKSVLLLFSLLLCLLLRKNMLASVILFIPFLILSLKGYRLKTSIIVAGSLLCFFAINNILYPSLGMCEGDTKEILCVPMQQIANTYRTVKNLSPEEIEYVETYIPTDALNERIDVIYNPRNADPIKYEFDESTYKESTLSFWKQYIKLGVKHPLPYIDAMLTLNIPYWYPFANPQDSYSGRQYIETDYDFFERTTAPSVLAFYEKISNFTLIDKIPIIKYLFYLSLPLWIIMVCLLGCLSGRNKSKTMIILPGLLLWLTYFIGPVSNYRYIYPLFILLPMYIHIFLKSNSQ